MPQDSAGGREAFQDMPESADRMGEHWHCEIIKIIKRCVRFQDDNNAMTTLTTATRTLTGERIMAKLFDIYCVCVECLFMIARGREVRPVFTLQ